MGSTLSCAGKGHSPKDQDLKPYGAPLPKANGIVAPSEKYIVPSGEYHKNKGVSFFFLTTRSTIFQLRADEGVMGRTTSVCIL